tara:strand:+ start:226 stop:570 length:345 start_codon:yes stop_codon:yes gene_type:complete
MEIIKDINMDTMWARSSSTLDILDQLNNLFNDHDPDKDVLFIDKERILKGRPVAVPDNPNAERKTINAAVNAMRVNVTRYGKSIAKNHSMQVRKYSEDGIFTGVFVKFIVKGIK